MTKIKNPALELLSGLSVTVVDNEKVFDFKEVPSKTKLGGMTAKKTNLQKFESIATFALAQTKKNKTLQDELSANTFANALLIDDLDKLREYTTDTTLATTMKKTVNDFPELFSPQTRTAYAALDLITKFPLAFLTKLMQVYEIQYLEGFEEGNLNSPKWTKITQKQVSELDGTYSSIICRLVPVMPDVSNLLAALAGENIQQAAIINDDFKIFNEHFLITDGLEMQMPSWDVTQMVSFVPPVLSVVGMPDSLSAFQSAVGVAGVGAAAPAPLPSAIGGGGVTPDIDFGGGGY